MQGRIALRHRSQRDKEGKRTVKHSDVILSFIERCEDNTPVENIVAAFRETIERLGILYFACYTHIADPLDPSPEGVLVHNYPNDWVCVYSEAKLNEIDPVLEYAERNPLPFSWEARAFRAHLTATQATLLAAASAFGLDHGYTIPIHLSWMPGSLRASLSVVPRAGAIDARSRLELQLIASCLYVAANRASASWEAAPIPALGQRERQCLTLVAQGKDDWTIGCLLKLSSATVHTYIERAKRRLQVATRTQAVVQAFMGRQISFDAIARTEDAQPAHSQKTKLRRTAARGRLKKLERLARSRHRRSADETKRF
jgi:DNA-binding CsgD family transcriptional regulator